MNRTISRVAAKAVVAVLAAVVLLPAAAASAKPAPAPTTPTGNDVSWPQCGKPLPTTHAFGIVGVNDGMANNTNACLATQLAWAHRAKGGTTQPKAQVYVNTGNPGGLNTPSWPKSDTGVDGQAVTSPYGACTLGGGPDGTSGMDSLGCAWMYGRNRAIEDVRDRFTPAAQSAGVNSDPATYPWWLDVELANSWKTGGTAFDYQSNVAVLEGMTTYFRSRGFTVGLYSTGYQWNTIVGSHVSAQSPLRGLDSWLAGARDLKSAKASCTLAPLTAGGRVALTQYVANNLDYDHSCIG